MKVTLECSDNDNIYLVTTGPSLRQIFAWIGWVKLWPSKGLQGAKKNCKMVYGFWVFWGHLSTEFWPSLNSLVGESRFGSIGRILTHLECANHVQMHDWPPPPQFLATNSNGYFCHFLHGYPPFWGLFGPSACASSSPKLRRRVSYAFGNDWGNLSSSKCIQTIRNGIYLLVNWRGVKFSI